VRRGPIWSVSAADSDSWRTREIRIEAEPSPDRDRITRLENDLRRCRRRGAAPRGRSGAVTAWWHWFGYPMPASRTLFNRLTRADVQAADMLLRRWILTLRALSLPHGGKGDVIPIPSDSSRTWPDAARPAFRATLEEGLEADIFSTSRHLA